MGTFRKLNEDLRKLCLELLPRYIGTAHEKMHTKVKEDSTPVTDLDNYALEQFRRVVSARLPNCRTIGEEDKRSAGEMEKILADEDNWYCYIDGLDGTWSYEQGTNSYGAQLCVRHGHILHYAMIFRPVDMVLRRNGFIYAQRGRGAWEWCRCNLCRGEYKPLRTASHSERRLVVLLEGSSKKFWTTEVSNIGANLTTRPSLSSCIAATTIARGMPEARAIVTVGHKPWDGWPIALLVEEAGGVVTDHEGNPYTANDCSNLVAAANATDHARVLELLNSDNGERKP